MDLGGVAEHLATEAQDLTPTSSSAGNGNSNSNSNSTGTDDTGDWWDAALLEALGDIPTGDAQPEDADEPEQETSKQPPTLNDLHRQQLLARGFSEAHLQWMLAQGIVRSLSWADVELSWLRQFPKARETETGGLLLCFNPKARRPHYSLRCDIPPVDAERGKPRSYLFPAGGGDLLAAWDPSGLIDQEGRKIPAAQIGTEGLLDALICTLVLGVPCVAVTAPSHLRKLALPESMRVYIGDCDQWMARDLLPVVVGQCKSKGLKVTRLPLREQYRSAYLGEHRDLPREAKGGMEELLADYGPEKAQEVVLALAQTAREPGDYLAWEIKELGAAGLGLRWPEHKGPIQSLISAMADAHRNNPTERDALKQMAVLHLNVGAKTVNDGIKGRLARLAEKDLEARQAARQAEQAAALARGETLAPEIDKEEPTNKQLQEWIGYAHTTRFNVLTREVELDGQPITDLKLAWQFLAQQHSIEAGKSQAADALLYVAQSNPYNPIADYLARVRNDASIVPLSREEIGQLFGLDPEDSLSADLLEIALAGTAKRGMEPGSDFDHCPILRGVQGQGKSKALRELVSRPWFDELDDKGSGSQVALSSWKVMEKASTCWIFELAEIDRFTRGKDQSALKAWVTCSVDQYAEKHERNKTAHPRMFVPWGTTNEKFLLNDETGNRRFLIIECPNRVDWPRIGEVRDQIWKAILLLLDSGFEPWFDPNSEKGKAAIDGAHERGVEAALFDPRSGILLAYLEDLLEQHRLISPERRETLARTGEVLRFQSKQLDDVDIRVRYFNSGHRASKDLALLADIQDLHEAVGIDRDKRNKGTTAEINRAMSLPEIQAMGWTQRKIKARRGFALEIPGGGGTPEPQPDTGPEPADPKHGSDSRGSDSSAVGIGTTIGTTFGTQTPCTGMDLPLVPILSEDSEITHEAVSISDSRSQDTVDSLWANAPTAEGIGTTPKPTAPQEVSGPIGESAPCLAPAETEPRPFSGTPPEGITYVATADQLPDPASLPRVLGFDLETFNRRTDLWRHKASLHPCLGGEIRLAQLSTGTNTLVVDVAVIGQPAIDWLRTLLRDPSRTMVGHNLLFEATYAIAAGIRPLCRWWDTMLASQLIGDLPGHSLAAVAAHYIGQELDKTEQTGDWGHSLTAAQLTYAAVDAQVVLPLRDRLTQELESTKQAEAHRLECQMISPCADGQVRGLAVDQQAVTEALPRAQADLAAKAARVHPLLGIENWRSAVKLKTALCGHLGVALENTKSKTLKRYAADPAVALLLELRELDQTIKELRWQEAEARLTDGRTRPHYSILGANTGRTTTKALLRANSCTVPSDTEVFKSGENKGQPKPVKLDQIGYNFQGLTSRSKDHLGTGDPDTTLLDVDWDSIEVRLQASPHLYNDSGQRQILFDNLDAHAYIASQVCGREIVKDENGNWPPERAAVGKVANFSLAYGCGVNNLALQLSLAQGRPVSQAEARKVYNTWHRAHPQISRRMDEFSNGAQITETRSVSGRRVRNRGREAGANGICPVYTLSRNDGINHPIQASGKDLLADAMGDLWPALDQFPGVRIVGLIHDEVLLEVPRNIVGKVQETVLAIMTSQRLQDRYLGDVPLKASANQGETWGEAH